MNPSRQYVRPLNFPLLENMKTRAFIAASTLSTLLFIGQSFASEELTGNAWAEVFGEMSMNDVATPYAVSIDEIDGDCDNTTQTCKIRNFSWSDAIGWTIWDGELIEAELPAFTEQYQAKATYRGMLDGFIWSEKTGWISLSACAGMDSLTCNGASYCIWNGSYCELDRTEDLPIVSVQDEFDWGVYIEFCPLKPDQPTCESATSNQYCNWDGTENECVFDSTANPNGQPVKGFALSEKLGWIKFGRESTDTGTVGFTGAFTNWMPDLTVPDLEALSLSNAWIPNQSTIGNITWPEFFTENDSDIDLSPAGGNKIFVNTQDFGGGGDFEGCPLAIAQMHENAVLTQQLTGEIDLDIPVVGILGTPPYGFCDFRLNGVVKNGWGFGYYFGDDGLTEAIADWGIDPTIDPDAFLPNIYDPNEITLYVRAGELSPADSELAMNITPSATTEVADGQDIVDSKFSPRDPAGNPIIAVRTALLPNLLPEPDQNLWVRDIPIQYDFNQSSEHYFDRVNITRNFANLFPTPVRIETDYYGFTDALTYPLGSPSNLPHIAGEYYMDVRSFAPTVAVGNVFSLDAIALNTVDAILPAISPSVGTLNTSSSNSIDSAMAALPSNPLNYPYNFDPQFEVTDGELSSDFITLGLPVTATYTVQNNSPGGTLDGFALDHSLAFTNISGIGQEVLEFRNINLNGLSDTTGRTDPESVGGVTRYQLTKTDATNTEGANQFHSNSAQFHDPLFSFYNNTSNSGIYSVPGSHYAGPSDVPPYPNMNIDRTDALSFNLNPGTSQNYSFSFTGDHYIGQQIGQVEFGIDQYMAYKATTSPYAQFAIYPATKFIDGIEIKSIGLGTSGVVSGGQVFETIGGRDLETITTTSSADLRREIRRNVAVLTRNLTPCDASLDPTFVASGTLPTSGSCIQEDSNNGTVIVYYSGDGVVSIGTGGLVTVPADRKYTIILDGGARLNLAGNITYGGDTDNSLGIILLSDTDGNGADVYVHPTPTNLVGLLYAEGSVLSSPDAGNNFYYGGGSGDANDLVNQLYWQGSIASQNTIGGAPNTVVPVGADCGPWADTSSCAQAYDLDFLRRFTVIHDTTDFAPNGYLFSGGGQCSGDAVNPACAHGPLGQNLSTVSIDAGQIDLTDSKSLDTLFIERDNRPVPPGFSSSGGLTSSQEIR